eukprot:TRINITY_DN6491_c0_g1_i1.p1 TRINITY_DN6491_c0_g1~~TRINITY_DN6491_c0_g1_i1.p1  ORF type:complete len:123 (+),score=18.77 TRINITY_DN6491_c0_g1_i1:48-371(+)
MSVSIPIRLLQEAEGHTVTVEMLTGELYRGNLADAEDNMNVKLSSLTKTERDGKVITMEQVFLRGSKIRFFIIPDMLRHAPMFKTIGDGGRGRGVGLAPDKRLGMTK